jgi:hypothetical protein
MNQVVDSSRDAWSCPQAEKLNQIKFFAFLTRRVKFCFEILGLAKMPLILAQNNPHVTTRKRSIVCNLLAFKRKKNLHGLSPLTNYIDRATAAFRRSDCQLFADRLCHVVSVTDPCGRILGFLDRSRYFSIK